MSFRFTAMAVVRANSVPRCEVLCHVIESKVARSRFLWALQYRRLKGEPPVGCQSTGEGIQRAFRQGHCLAKRAFDVVLLLVTKVLHT